MLNHYNMVGFCACRATNWRCLTIALVIAASVPSLGASGCGASTAASGVASAAAATTATPTTGTATFAATSSSSGVAAVQIITKADSSGSFDAVSVPMAGGVSVRASRLWNLDGSMITTGNVPSWFIEARAFLTSTRTSAGAPGSSGQLYDTPCAYFDNVTDVNPDTSGFYTIDGYNPSTGGTDIDQCTGAAAAEQNQTGMYVRIDRRFMNASDKLQIIVKAKPIDEPNTAVTPSSCVTSGFFDPAACTNQLYTLSLRTTPGASTKPFYILFPSAKALDLLTESVLVPINIDQSISTISIDRVKGGALIYGITVIRLL